MPEAFSSNPSGWYQYHKMMSHIHMKLHTHAWILSAARSCLPVAVPQLSSCKSQAAILTTYFTQNHVCCQGRFTTILCLSESLCAQLGMDVCREVMLGMKLTEAALLGSCNLQVAMQQMSECYMWTEYQVETSLGPCLMSSG